MHISVRIEVRVYNPMDRFINLFRNTESGQIYMRVSQHRSESLALLFIIYFLRPEKVHLGYEKALVFHY